MNPEPHPSLDNDELLHLAIEATRSSRHGDAIQYLKRAMAGSGAMRRYCSCLAPNTRRSGCTTARPRTWPARSSSTRARSRALSARTPASRSRETRGSVGGWKQLDSLGENDPYLHFKRGLESLAKDDFARAGIPDRGLALNNSNRR